MTNAQDRGHHLATHPTPGDDAMYQDGYATMKGLLPRLEDRHLAYVTAHLADVTDRPAYLAGMHAAVDDHLARLADDPVYVADHAARVHLERSLDFITAGGSKAGLLEDQLQLQDEAKAKALGITLGQYRNRDNPYMPHCPVCSKPLDHLTIGRDNWAYCDTCRVRVNTGSGLNAWREHDNDVDRERNRRHLEGYRDLSDDEFYGPGWDSAEARK